jgi:predicted acetyltransferase
VLVVCDHENTASIKLIEKSGGELIDEVYSPRCQKPVRRYWMKSGPVKGE